MRDLIFWSLTSNGMRISVTGMMRLLSEKGIRRYFISSDPSLKPILVEVINNKVRPVDEGYLLETLMFFINNHGNEHVMEAFLRMRNPLSFERLSSLPRLEGGFLKDTTYHSYFFFSNVVCDVTGERITLIPYEKVTGLIWTSQIIDHVIEIVAYEEIRKNLKFFRFLEDITVHQTVDSERRLLHLVTLIGYLLHGYKDPINPRAVVLMDENLSERPEGGTGKTLISDAISKVRKVTSEDGKNFKPSERFAFQQVQPDTKIILFDDAGKDFAFERIFPAITSSLPVEKKNKDKFSLPFDISPKILITTNYAISGNGGSFRRRIYEFELSQHFNDSFTPIQAYGKRFFNQWTKKEWDMFYCLLMECTLLYLKDGVKTSTSINLEYKKLMNELPKPLIEYFKISIKSGREYNRRSLYELFKKLNQEFSEMTQHLFSRHLDTYAAILNMEIASRKSGSTQYFTLIPKNSTIFPPK